MQGLLSEFKGLYESRLKSLDEAEKAGDDTHKVRYAFLVVFAVLVAVVRKLGVSAPFSPAVRSAVRLRVARLRFEAQVLTCLGLRAPGPAARQNSQFFPLKTPTSPDHLCPQCSDQ